MSMHFYSNSPITRIKIAPLAGFTPNAAQSIAVPSTSVGALVGFTMADTVKETEGKGFSGGADVTIKNLNGGLNISTDEKLKFTGFDIHGALSSKTINASIKMPYAPGASKTTSVSLNKEIKAYMDDRDNRLRYGPINDTGN
jgi:hypothetical protein